jgi:hypothetical protein
MCKSLPLQVFVVDRGTSWLVGCCTTEDVRFENGFYKGPSLTGVLTSLLFMVIW